MTPTSQTNIPISTSADSGTGEPPMAEPSAGAFSPKVKFRKIVRDRQGPLGKITTIRHMYAGYVSPKSQKTNPKKNREVRRPRPSMPDYELERNASLVRADGAKITRVMGRHEAKARRCRYFHEQMDGTVGKPRK